ncbi:MAG: gas vesicle protein [Acidobacteriales bacterium]|nr:gas vesicle protein [Terriglobales bacterium]
MGVERNRNQTSLIDILDRVLDKGIVIDAWIRISLVGVDLVTIESRVVIASIETYLMHAPALSAVNLGSKPNYLLPMRD